MTVIERAFTEADAKLWAEHGAVHIHGFYVSANLMTDHIYPNCPHLRRGFAAVNREPTRANGVLYPEAGDVCGWCLRIWRARQKDARKPPPHP